MYGPLREVERLKKHDHSKADNDYEFWSNEVIEVSIGGVPFLHLGSRVGIPWYSMVHVVCHGTHVCSQSSLVLPRSHRFSIKTRRIFPLVPNVQMTGIKYKVLFRGTFCKCWRGLELARSDRAVEP